MEPTMPEQKTVTIYLTSWQKRMVADHVKGLTAITKAVITSKIDPGSLVKYRVPNDLVSKNKWNFYLSDEQIAQLSEIHGIKAKFSALNVSKELLDSGAIAFH